MPGPVMSDFADEIAELVQTARVHSASREFERSLPIRKRLVALAPEDWGNVLDLVQDLRGAGELVEADEVHRRAVLRFPEEFWIVYHWALAAWNHQDYPLAEQRSLPLLALLQQLPSHKRNDVEGHASWLLGSLAMKRHAYQEAVLYSERACHLAPQDADLAGLLRRARHYGRLAVSFGFPPLLSAALRVAADYSVLVINLDRDTERFRRLCHRFRDSPVELVRVPGVYGSYLPRSALQDLCRASGGSPAGSAGCLLTHVKAWETIVARGPDLALILEDDAMPMVHLPHRFATLGIPPDFDLCFVNRKMEPQFDADAASGVDTTAIFDPIEASLTFHPAFNSPGTDGYFMSASGARKMLAFIERDGFGVDADWRLIQYSVATGAGERLPPESMASAMLRQMDSLPEERLRAFTLFPCLIDVDTSYINSRVTENLKARA